MKNTISIIAALLFLGIVGAQERHRLEFETLGGYEHNYFKSPTIVVQDGNTITEDQLVASSSYQDVSAKYNYRKSWKENRIRFAVSPSTRIFYDNQEDSYWSLNASAKYDRELSKKMDFLINTSFKRMNREGLDGAQDVLINPLGYTFYGAATGLKVQPIRNNTTTVMGFYNFKNFDAFGIRNLQYNQYGLEIKTKQEFKVNNATHAYGVELNINKRLYDTFNASEVVVDGERNWAYFKGELFYELPISKTLNITPSYVYYSRTDNSENRSGFVQSGPILGLKFDNDVTKVRSSIKHLTRNYTTLDARNNLGLIGEKIQYNYADVSLNIVHQLGNNGFALTGEVYSRVRTTNYTDFEARSFRGYRNQYAGLGLKWTL